MYWLWQVVHSRELSPYESFISEPLVYMYIGYRKCPPSSVNLFGSITYVSELESDSEPGYRCTSVAFAANPLQANSLHTPSFVGSHPPPGTCFELLDKENVNDTHPPVYLVHLAFRLLPKGFCHIKVFIRQAMN